MTLDLLDAAFVRRWQTKPRHPLPTDAPEPRQVPPPASVVPPVAIVPPAELPIGDGIVPRLLAAAGPQWQALADRLEAARLRGCRVIAVAGGTAGEGRSTLVDCLVAVLRARGRDVLRLDAAELAARTGREPTHDKRIVLVDAGIWFPPGPIRRPRLLAVSQGCDAAILVRRSGAATATAWEAALAAIGIEVLGEVLTFTPDADDQGGDSSSFMGPL